MELSFSARSKMRSSNSSIGKNLRCKDPLPRTSEGEHLPGDSQEVRTHPRQTGSVYEGSVAQRGRHAGRGAFQERMDMVRSHFSQIHRAALSILEARDQADVDGRNPALDLEIPKVPPRNEFLFRAGRNSRHRKRRIEEHPTLRYGSPSSPFRPQNRRRRDAPAAQGEGWQTFFSPPRKPARLSGYRCHTVPSSFKCRALASWARTVFLTRSIQ